MKPLKNIFEGSFKIVGGSSRSTPDISLKTLANFYDEYSFFGRSYKYIV
jgi:hypothetical protein